MAFVSKDSHGPPVFDGKPASGSLSSGWYQKDVEEIGLEERELLEEYSGLPPDQVIPHVLELRDRAFKIWSYACIGQMRFLAFNLRCLPFYQEIVTRLNEGATFCDAGCCFGQEIRHLVHTHNLDSARFFGFDLELPFIHMGYELFCDRDRLQATFAAGNVLDNPSADPQTSDESPNGLAILVNKMDVVFCSSLLHVFDWEQMLVAACTLVALTRPQAGSIICGKQLGSVRAGSYKMPTAHGTNYRHNEESMERFWKEVGDRTATRWRVESGLYEGLFELAQNQEHAWSDPDQRMIWWKVTRS